MLKIENTEKLHKEVPLEWPFMKAVYFLYITLLSFFCQNLDTCIIMKNVEKKPELYWFLIIRNQTCAHTSVWIFFYYIFYNLITFFLKKNEFSLLFLCFREKYYFGTGDVNN